MWLQSFAGKYFVLLFYPLDWTFVCPTEIVEFSDLIEDFQVTNKHLEYCATDDWTDTNRRPSARLWPCPWIPSSPILTGPTPRGGRHLYLPLSLTVPRGRSQGGVGSVKIPLLADKGGHIARAFGCFNEAEGVAFRGLYIVDKKMKIRHIRDVCIVSRLFVVDHTCHVSRVQC